MSCLSFEVVSVTTNLGSGLTYLSDVPKMYQFTLTKY